MSRGEVGDVDVERNFIWGEWALMFVNFNRAVK